MFVSLPNRGVKLLNSSSRRRLFPPVFANYGSRDPDVDRPSQASEFRGSFGYAPPYAALDGRYSEATKRH